MAEFFFFKKLVIKHTPLSSSAKEILVVKRLIALSKDHDQQFPRQWQTNYFISHTRLAIVLDVGVTGNYRCPRVVSFTGGQLNPSFPMGVNILLGGI